MKNIKIDTVESEADYLANLKRKVIYVFQGGGALGTYQVGAYEALENHAYHPDMIVGISIGAINAALIAGNPQEKRRERLFQFWNRVTTKFLLPRINGGNCSKIYNWYSANSALIAGQPGFFTPRIVNPWLLKDTTPDQLSFYDTTPLRESLLELVDFEYLNQKHVRLCLGAVELSSGNFAFFDSNEMEIKVEHIMASGALPPGFPPVEIEDKYYVDGGVFSNTPLFKVVDEFAKSSEEMRNILCFMVDLFSASGPLPHSLDGLLERVKDIQYSSHSKRTSALYATTQNLSHAINYLTSKLTPEQLADDKVQKIIKLGFAHRLDVVRIVYRSPRGTELHSKDYEFSVSSANTHRIAGFNNASNLIKEKGSEWSKKHKVGLSIYTLD